MDEPHGGGVDVIVRTTDPEGGAAVIRKSSKRTRAVERPQPKKTRSYLYEIMLRRKGPEGYMGTNPFRQKEHGK